MEKIFVYGTLKKGYHNHRLLEGLKGEPAKAPGINLHRGFHFPYACKGPGTAIGELYEVSEEVLASIDKLEGHPYFYERVKTKVYDANFKSHDAWIYLYSKGMEYPRIESGEWNNELR